MIRRRAFGRIRPRSGEMNKLEAAWGQTLELMKAATECDGDLLVLSYWFQPIKLRLADNTFYTPDFLVLMSDGTLEVHEVKGHWEDDARVKIKVAAEHFPFVFKAITREKGKWKIEVI